MESTERRLPVYVLLDVSGSMQGDPIQAVNMGLQFLVEELLDDPKALEIAYVSLITFNREAKQLVPLTPVSDLKFPTLSASGSTCLGAALTLLSQCIEQEVRKPTAKFKADYKPLVFLLTDGQPTDSWEGPAQDLRARRPAEIIACAAGADADEMMLRQITENVVNISSLNPSDLSDYFKFVSKSIKTGSRLAPQGREQRFNSRSISIT